MTGFWYGYVCGVIMMFIVRLIFDILKEVRS